MKKLLILAMVMAIYGCTDQEPPAKSNYQLSAKGVLYNIYCIRNVEYILVNGSYSRSIAPLLRVDGSVTPCDLEDHELEYLEDLEYHGIY